MSLGLAPDAITSVTIYTNWFCNPICRLNPVSVFQSWIPTRKSSTGALPPRFRFSFDSTSIPVTIRHIGRKFHRPQPLAPSRRPRRR